MAGRAQERVRSAKARPEPTKPRRVPAPQQLLYTAQDVARFCEVDLKTIHHWADAGKIAHHRTEGRHLRFRRNHVISFLRSHGYPIHEQIGTSRPHLFLALPRSLEGSDDATKKLATRFFVRRFDSALSAVAHLVATGPDALIVSADDATWNWARGIRALKTDTDTAWPLLVLVSPRTEEHAAMKDAGADLVIDTGELARLHLELAQVLSVD